MSYAFSVYYKPEQQYPVSSEYLLQHMKIFTMDLHIAAVLVCPAC